MPYKHTSVLDRLRDYRQYSQHYLKIKTKKSGLVNLVFNKAQQVIWRAIQAQMTKGLPVQLAILKGRQLGASTFCQGLIFWRTVTRRNTASLVIAHTTEAAQGIFTMAQTMYEELPEDLRPMLRRSNKKELLFENPHVKNRLQNPGLRSRIEVRTAGNEEAGRGITYHALHLSEVASWPDPEVLATSLFPTVPQLPTSIIVLESTAKGGGTWWHDMYVKSKSGDTGYEAIFLPWFLDPEYALPEEELEKWMDDLDEEELQLQALHKLTINQLGFRRKMIASYGEDYFRQEYPSNDEEAWLGIGTPVFNREAVRHMYEDALTHKPLFVGNVDKSTGDLVEGDGSWLRIWQMPEPGRSYVIGVDTSAGVEGGSDCAIVVLTRGLDQHHVATWAGRMNALQLVPFIEALGWMYNEALVSVEINYAGIATQEALSRVYTNSYRWRYLDRRSLTPTEKVGWLTTQTTKPLLIAHTVHQINIGRIHTVDEELLKQAYGYAYIDNQREIAVPEPGTRDDILLAFMIASYTDFLDGLYDRPHLKSKQLTSGPPPTEAFNKKNDPIYTEMAPDPFVGDGGGPW